MDLLITLKPIRMENEIVQPGDTVKVTDGRVVVDKGDMPGTLPRTKYGPSLMTMWRMQRKYSPGNLGTANRYQKTESPPGRPRGNRATHNQEDEEK